MLPKPSDLGPRALRSIVRKLANEPCRPVSLKNLFQFGASADPGQRLRNAQFLHRELPIRMAHRVEELYHLPFGLSQRGPIITVREWYESYMETMTHSPFPSVSHDDEEFTRMLQTILQDHSSVVKTLSMGVLELRRDLGEDFDFKTSQDVDSVLNRFYMARIGLRFLISHHVEARRNRANFKGIIQSDCRPAEVAQWAAEDATSVCTRAMGDCPEISIHGSIDAEFTYVPGHIHYMLFEILKNASRAVMDTHGGKAGDLSSLPPIKVIIARGDEDITIKVADEGGGIARGDMWKIFTYMHTTASPPDDHELLHDRTDEVRLAGYGVGLPLSKLYAEYFGGNLHLSSMEGFGTDAYLHLNRLGTLCENLPPLVRASPAERDSSLYGRTSLDESPY